MTDRLPIYHDDDLISTNSATSPMGGATKEGGVANATGDSMVGPGPPPPTELEVVL